MSTNSVIALAVGDGFTGGVYVHSDGYPTAMGPAIALLAERKGSLAAAWEALADSKAGWSMIQPNRREWYAEFKAKHPNSVIEEIPTYLDERGEWVEGVGYRHNGVGEPLFDPIDWHGGDFDWGPWVYALNPTAGTIAVFVVDGAPQLQAVVRCNDEDIDWSAIECGKNYERCGHYAYVHFGDDVDERSQRLTTNQWLGIDPLRVTDAYAVDNGNGVWRLRGGHLERKPGGGYGNKWFASCIGEPGAWNDGHTADIYVWTHGKNGTARKAPRVKLLYPPTKEAAT